MDGWKDGRLSEKSGAGSALSRAGAACTFLRSCSPSAARLPQKCGRRLPAAEECSVHEISGMNFRDPGGLG